MTFVSSLEDFDYETSEIIERKIDDNVVVVVMDDLQYF